MDNAIDLVQIRAASESDHPFIYGSWLNHNRNSSHLSWNVSNTLFFDTYQRLIKTILGKKTTQVIIACMKDDPDLIVGYAVVEYGEDVPVLHYCYVKKSFRGMGVGRLLWTAAGLNANDPFVVTCATQELLKGGLLQKYPNAIYNPYAFFMVGVEGDIHGEESR